MKNVLLVLFLVALVVADAAPLLHADGSQVIPGSYIIVLKDGVTSDARDAHVESLKDTITNTQADAEVGESFNIGSLIGFSARLSEDLLQAQLTHPNVKYIEADQVMSINYEQEKHERAPFATVTQTGATWGLVRVAQHARELFPANYVYNDTAGTDVEVYVIDTGILLTHVDFGGRAKFAYTAISTEDPTDLNGHGTHCAGTIGGTTYGVAKNVELYSVKVLNEFGKGATSGVINGINYVTNQRNKEKQAVASVSLGGGISSTLDVAVAKSIAGGVVYAVAAGNDNADACKYSPARVKAAVTVGATTTSDARSSFSNFGTCLDIFAPGSLITSDWIGSDTAIKTVSGTSMATPHVAGILALHLGDFPSTPSDSRTWLLDTATPDVITDPGTGSPTCLAFSPSDSL